MVSYARADVLVETGWLQEHLGDPNLRIVESNEDPELYAQGHIPGAIHLRWKTDLQDPVRRDWVSRAQLEQLLGFRGIGNEHTIVLYGDKNNWFATYTFWLLSYYGGTWTERRPAVGGGGPAAHPEGPSTRPHVGRDPAPPCGPRDGCAAARRELARWTPPPRVAAAAAPPATPGGARGRPPPGPHPGTLRAGGRARPRRSCASCTSPRGSPRTRT
jgi:hypothetical protein